MKRLTTFTTLVARLILMTLATGGLETTSAERVAMYEQANQKSAAMDEKIESIEAIVTATRTAMTDPNCGIPAVQKFADTLATAQSELARLAPIKQKTGHVLQALEQQLAEVRDGSEVGLSDEVQFLGDALKTGGAAVPGPAGLYMTIGGSVITGVGTLITGLKKGKKQGQAKEWTHTAEIVKSLDKVIAKGLISDMEDFADTMDKKQSPTTQAIVNQIQGKSAA